MHSTKLAKKQRRRMAFKFAMLSQYAAVSIIINIIPTHAERA